MSDAFMKIRTEKCGLGLKPESIPVQNEVLVKEEEIQKQLPDIMVHSLCVTKEIMGRYFPKRHLYLDDKQ